MKRVFPPPVLSKTFLTMLCTFVFLVCAFLVILVVKDGATEVNAALENSAGAFLVLVVLFALPAALIWFVVSAFVYLCAVPTADQQLRSGVISSVIGGTVGIGGASALWGGLLNAFSGDSGSGQALERLIVLAGIAVAIGIISYFVWRA